MEKKCTQKRARKIVYACMFTISARRRTHAYTHTYARAHKNKYPNAEFACHLCRKCADRHPPSEQQRRRPWRWQGLADSNSSIEAPTCAVATVCTMPPSR